MKCVGQVRGTRLYSLLNATAFYVYPKTDNPACVLLTFDSTYIVYYFYRCSCEPFLNARTYFSNENSRRDNHGATKDKKHSPNAHTINELTQHKTQAEPTSQKNIYIQKRIPHLTPEKNAVRCFSVILPALSISISTIKASRLDRFMQRAYLRCNGDHSRSHCVDPG